MQETTIWRNIHCNVTSEWTETVEVVDELSKHSGLFWVCYLYIVLQEKVEKFL